MRLVDFEEFCRMPAGTVFAPYDPMVLSEGLAIKTDAGEDMPADYKWLSHDFLGVMPLEPDWDPDSPLWNVGDTFPASFEIYDGTAVDYIEYKMFLVFDKSDIDRMINALVWAKNGCIGPCDCSVRGD